MTAPLLKTLLDALDPPLAAPQRRVIERFSEQVERQGLYVTGHERVGPTLRVHFTDDARRVLLSVDEMERWLAAAEAGEAPPLPTLPEGDPT
ncbi:MAG: hypothetical protein H6739_21445 [Alphaproteobacteria bacterium]|nr:hypothetical protein [Alphaproteobacteria bacterium]